MDAGKAFVTDILGGNKKVFVIPIYQRNYSWRKKECLKLYNDILNASQFQNIKDYFIGTIVYTELKSDMNYNEYTLIDGQQRLTTISLLLKAISRKVLENSEEDEYEITETYLKNKKIALEEYGYVLKLKPNNKDATTYEEIMDDKEVTDKSSLLYLNYMLFLDWLENKNYGLSAKKIFNCIERVKLVYISLDPKEDDPQLVFETINSTGRDLEFSDLIRNFVLVGETHEHQTKLYNEYWRKIEEVLKKDRNSYVEGFIRSYLLMQKEKVFSKENTYLVFRDFYGPLRVDSEVALNTMLEYANIYRNIADGYKNNKKLHDTFKIFHELDYTLTYPFLMRILYDYSFNGFDEKELIRIVKLLSSFLIRKTIMGVNLTQQFATLMTTMYSKIKHSKNKYEAFASYFLEQESQKLKFTSDDSFYNELLVHDIYNSRAGDYILKSLEDFKSKERIDYDSITSTISVDHIMPQKPNEDWKKRIPVNDAYLENLHRLGNLTLTAYNSEKGNKVKDVYTNSKITLNKNIDISKWDIKHISKRSKLLAKQCLDIWPYPSDIKIAKKVKPADYTEISDLDLEDIVENKLLPSHIKLEKNEARIVKNWEEVEDTVIEYIKLNYSSKLGIIAGYNNNFTNEKERLQCLIDYIYIVDENLSIKIALQ